MRRLRVRRAPPGTLDLLLKLTNRHVHAQLVDRTRGTVMLGVHTNEKAIRGAIAARENAHINGYATASVKAAGTVGEIFGERANHRGVHTVFWTAPGKYHGKIKAFIDAVRASGIKTIRSNPHNVPKVPEVTN